MANDHRRGLVWRVASIATVVILVVLWRACLGGPKYVVQIQFGLNPEALVGAEVVIDGKVAGVLERRGGTPLNGFRVEEGDHTAELRRPGCESVRRRFTTGFGGARVLLVALPDIRVQGGDTVCVLGWEP